MINRKIFNDLVKWKEGENRKPLILKWARQVWKSFIVKEFWKKEFRKIHEVNFQLDWKFSEVFDKNLDPEWLIKNIEYLLWEKINIKEDLLFFDEVQDCQKAITSLKFFCEKLPDLAVISAWSYLWLINNQESFPVWKVEFLSMFPINFEEFLESTNKFLYEVYIKINFNTLEKIDDFYHQEFLKVLQKYFIIWWMPEVVNKYKNWDLSLDNSREIRNIQNNLLESYERDFFKYSWMVNAWNLLSVYDSIANQLEKTYNESINKFKFSWVIRWKKWFNELDWYLTFLSKSRLVIKNYIANKAEKPLKWYIKNNFFKLFFHDIWLLNAKLWVDFYDFVNEKVWSYKWYIVENFVAQELFFKKDQGLISRSEWKSEIEFLIEKGNKIIPIEVKSSKKYSQAKSLWVFIKKYSPEIAYKFTMENFYKSDRWYKNIPIYLIWKIF